MQTPVVTLPDEREQKLRAAAAANFQRNFSGEDASTDREAIVKSVLSEKMEKKKYAFSLLFGFLSTGLIPGKKVAEIITQTIPADREERVPAIVDAYLKTEPEKNEDVLEVMESVKEHFPGLIAKIMHGKKSWEDKDRRKIFIKYVLTEELWIQAEEIERKEAEAQPEQQARAI